MPSKVVYGCYVLTNVHAGLGAAEGTQDEHLSWEHTGWEYRGVLWVFNVVR